MHHDLRHAIAQSHIDDLCRDAARRRLLARLDAPVSQPQGSRRRLTPQRRHAGRVVPVNGANQ
jgi:hypothetical protein